MINLNLKDPFQRVGQKYWGGEGVEMKREKKNGWKKTPHFPGKWSTNLHPVNDAI